MPLYIEAWCPALFLQSKRFASPLVLGRGSKG